MVDTSSMYNLSNPALNDDIGLNCLNKSLPITPNGFDGEPYVPDKIIMTKKMQHLLINSQNLQQLKKH